MNDHDLKKMAQAEKEQMSVPETVRDAVEETLASLPEREAEVVSRKTHHRWKLPAGLVAACLALFLILPNTAYPVARAMSDLPVLGTVFRAVTFREYSEQNGSTAIDVKTPKIESDPYGDSAASVSKEIEAMNEAALEQFKKEHISCGTGSYRFDYEVICDTGRWYTVKVIETEQGADTVSVEDYYTFDKTTGDSLILSDLFEKDEYIEHISDNIKTQMRQQMKTDDTADYFLDTDLPEEDFDAIDPNQDFYFDSSGDLVICFDEAEVAPASMGTVSFTIPQSVYASDLAPEYK